MPANPAAWQDLRDRGFERIRKLTRGRQSALDYERSPAFLSALRARQSMAARRFKSRCSQACGRARSLGRAGGNRLGSADLGDPARAAERPPNPHRAAPHPALTGGGRHPFGPAEARTYVFAGQKTGKPLSNMAMISVLKDLNWDESGEPRWVDPKSGRPITPHGLRATFRTWGEDVGFPRELLEEALGHQIGTAVERAYRRTDSFDAAAPSCRPGRTFATAGRSGRQRKTTAGVPSRGGPSSEARRGSSGRLPRTRPCRLG